jgi:hypothetical protein
MTYIEHLNIGYRESCHFDDLYTVWTLPEIMIGGSENIYRRATLRRMK